MSSRIVRLSAAAAMLWLCGAATSRGGFQDWSYTWERDPFAVPSNAGGQGGIASIKLPTLPTGGGSGASPIAPMVVVAGTNALGTALSPADLFHNAPFTVTFTITDDQTNASHPFVFQGHLNGSMTTSLVDLTASFIGGDQQSHIISGRMYTVTLSFLASDAPASSFAGDIGASAAVAGLPTTVQSPEPTSLILIGLALPAVGALAWRRRCRFQAHSSAGQ
ncbi:MAG TPA: PEP-CTERM sorting domain-containing protein [Gemmataceae bacterium]|nr:PEP-CTERM sorting domain-containing protein [Gemmataceae bacterium]